MRTLRKQGEADIGDGELVVLSSANGVLVERQCQVAEVSEGSGTRQEAAVVVVCCDAR